MPVADKTGFKEFMSYYWSGESINGYQGVGSYTGDKLEINQQIDAMINTPEEAKHFLNNSLSDFALA